MPDRPDIKVQMVHLHGPFKGQIQDYTQDEISIGRHPSSTLCFPRDLKAVSRNHAEIKREGNRFKLIDHSTNGTFVNGKSVRETVLKNGDVLTFADGGPKVSFLYELHAPDSGREKIPESEPPGDGKAETLRPAAAQTGATAESKPGESPSGHNKVKAPLIVQYGPSLRSFSELPVVIGSGAQVDCVIDHPSIHARHAEILFDDGLYWIKDLTGQSTVTVSNRPAGSRIQLSPQDIVAMSPEGPHFVFLGGGRLAETESES
jgi:pSer/pThr/pTyr-binding forkhead associated (FHA) protein